MSPTPPSRTASTRTSGALELEREGALAAWLAHQRHTPTIAEQLHVHPPTVRYRIAKLHELLSDALDTPEGRFGLELAAQDRPRAAPRD